MTDRTLSLGLSDGLPDGSPERLPGARPSSGPANPGEQELLARCSFCGLGEGEVERLFQGREGYICGECVDVCIDLLADFRELGVAPPESKRSWYQRWFSEAIDVACSFTPHDSENPQGGRLFPGHGAQICEHCVRACGTLKTGHEIDPGV